MRSKHFKTITDGKDSFSLWIDAGKPDKEYASNEKDQYYLYLEHNDYIFNTGLTEHRLEERAGEILVNQAWYGGSLQGRQKYFQDNFYEGRTYEEYRPLVQEQLDKEEAFIKNNPDVESMKVKLIRQYVDASIKRYLDARDNKGDRADFAGALFLDELDKCVELAARLNEKEKRLREEAEQKEQEKQDAENKRLIQEAEGIFKTGGTIKGGEVIVMLAEKYDINIPIRTKGWILNSLAECSVIGDSISYKYWRKSKHAKGSQTAFTVLAELQAAIKEAA